MRATAATAALVLATVLTTEGRAGEPPALWVVVNEANPVQTLSVDELRAIFTASLRFWAHGGPIAPFNAPAGTPNRVLFDEVVLRLGPREAGQFWVDQKVRGGPPPRARWRRRWCWWRWWPSSRRRWATCPRAPA